MMKIAVLLVIGVIARQTYGEPQAILGGHIATAGQLPHQVSFQIYTHFCGGTLISDRHIVTAAHCVDDPEVNKYTVVATGNIKWEKGEKHKIKCIRVHPGYTGKIEDSWKDDIAVVTLEKPIEINRYQKPIPLATKNYATGEYRAITSGWGQTSLKSDASPVLKWLEVGVLSEENCLKRRGKPSTIETQMCALERVGHGACSGDSGGPLMVNGELSGVTSWVALCALGVPDVFTNVYYYRDFIKECQNMC